VKRTFTSIDSTMTATSGSPPPPGAAHQSAAIIGTIRLTNSPSHGLRPPSLSMAAPRKGAVTMTIQPAYCW
jgi:hypothetical protein